MIAARIGPDMRIAVVGAPSYFSRRSTFDSLCRPRHRCRAVPVRSLKVRKALPQADISYALKANPLPEIISVLASLGAHFDITSSGEIDICPGIKVSPERLFEPRSKAKHVGAGR
jgi:hypothetical protein